MAEKKDPFADFDTPDKGAKDPFADFDNHKAEAGPTATETAVDAGKGAVSGLGTGVLSVPGMPGDLQNLAQGAADKATSAGYNPFSFLAQKFEDSKLGKFLKEDTAKHPTAIAQIGSGDLPGSYKMPTTKELQSKVEETTGPFYQATTPIGKAAQTAASVAPMIALGGEGLPGVVAKSAGAGIASEGAGEAADALKGHLPQAAQPYAEPVSRAIGAVIGSAGPAGIRRAITPLPMTDQRLATVNALRQTNPELVDASTAGQLTESPRIAAMEARSPRMADLPQQQAEAYTQGVMRQAGAPGQMFDRAGLNVAQGTGAQIEALRNAHAMSPAEFAALNKDVDSTGRVLFRATGNPPGFMSIKNEIANGPSGGNPMPLNMTGERYGALKQMIRSAPTGTTNEDIALGRVGGALDTRFQNSMPSAEAQRLRDLYQQYSNYKTVENIPMKPGENTLSPVQVHAKALPNSGLEAHADQAAQVMRPLPPPNHEISPLTTQAAAIGNSLLHGGAGLHFGGGMGAVAGAGEGYLGGLFGAESLVNAAKDVAGRAVASKPAQAVLGNQFWRPGPNSSADAALIARLLMTPPVTQAGK